MHPLFCVLKESARIQVWIKKTRNAFTTDTSNTHERTMALPNPACLENELSLRWFWLWWVKREKRERQPLETRSPRSTECQVTHHASRKKHAGSRGIATSAANNGLMGLILGLHTSIVEHKNMYRKLQRHDSEGIETSAYVDPRRHTP